MALIALRLFFLFFIIPHLPHLENYKYTNYFSAMITGDDTGYYKLAEMVYKFDFKEHPWTLDFPLLIVPFIFVFGHGFFNVFLPLVIFNAVFLFCGAIFLIVWTAFLIFSASAEGGKKIFPAVFSGFLFVLFPFIFYIFRNFGPHFQSGNWNDFNFFHMNWLTAMSDPLSAFLAYLILFLLVLSFQKERPTFYYVLLGFLTGYAMMVRVSNITIAAAVAIILLMFSRDKLKKLFFYAVSALVGFLPQFLYNTAFFGSPIKFGYEGAYREWVDIYGFKGPVFGIGNFIHLLFRAVHYSWLAIPVFLILGAFVLAGIFYIKKIDKKIALILALWFFFPVLFYMLFTSGQTTMRYYMPAIMPFVILLVAALSFISEKFKKNYLLNSFSSPKGPLNF
jgi:hypothetical protein